MVHKLEGHTNEIVAVNFYPELGLLFTGSLDGTIHVWNSTTYKYVCSFNSTTTTSYMVIVYIVF